LNKGGKWRKTVENWLTLLTTGILLPYFDELGVLKIEQIGLKMDIWRTTGLLFTTF
jgi:hypothetical protein